MKILAMSSMGGGGSLGLTPQTLRGQGLGEGLLALEISKVTHVYDR